MRRNSEPAVRLAAVLPSGRLVLVFAGVLVLAESAVVAAALIAAALLSLPLGVVLGAVIYRASRDRPSAPSVPASAPRASVRGGRDGVTRLPLA